MNGQPLAWGSLILGGSLSLAASCLLIGVGWRIYRTRLSLGLVPYFVYLAGFFALWVVAPVAGLIYFQIKSIDLLTSHPFLWLLPGPLGLAGLVAGSVLASLPGAPPKTGEKLQGIEEIAGWILSLGVFLVSSLIPDGREGWAAFVSRSLQPLLLVGPFFSLVRHENLPNRAARVLRTVAVVFFALGVMLDGGRITGCLILLMTPLLALVGGVSQGRLLLKWFFWGILAVTALGFIGLLRIAVNDVEWEPRRKIRSWLTYSQAIEKIDHHQYGFFEIGADDANLLSPAVCRLAQIESLWFMEAAQVTGHRTGWIGMDILPKAFVPRFLGGARHLLFDAAERYAVYGFRPRKAMEYSALPLRTLADVYERFRWPGVFLFHFFVGAWLMMLGRFVLCLVPFWWSQAAIAVWIPLIAAGLEMGLLENLNRFSYSVVRDFLLAGAALGTLMVVAKKFSLRGRGQRDRGADRGKAAGRGVQPR